MVKHTPLPSGVYLTVYPSSCPYTDTVFMTYRFLFYSNSKSLFKFILLLTVANGIIKYFCCSILYFSVCIDFQIMESRIKVNTHQSPFSWYKRKLMVLPKLGSNGKVLQYYFKRIQLDHIYIWVIFDERFRCHKNVLGKYFFMARLYDF